MSMTSMMVRTMFKKGDDIRDAGLTTPEDIERFDDICYGADARWQVLDVYRPRDAEGIILPVIVSVHGGGWVYGDKERYQYYCMSLAQRGFAVVNYTYRLAPEFQYPAPLEDTNLVFHWVLQNAPDYGLDRSHIFAVGDSAGAHLLGLFCNICTNPRYREEFTFRPPEGFVPAAVALNCGMYEIKPDEGGATGALMSDFLPEKGSSRELEQISVLRHIVNGFPPAFVMTASDDFLQGQVPALRQKLEEMEVPYEYHFYGDQKNKLPHVFHCNMKLADAKLCNEDECSFFRRFCEEKQ